MPAGIILTPAHVEGKKRDPAAPSGINYHFKPLIIVYLDDDSMNTRFVKQGKKRIGSGENFFDGSAARIPEGGINNHNARIDMITKVTVPAGASKKVRFLLCGADIESMNFLVAKYTEIMASDALLPSMGHWFADNAISFDMPDLHWLEREVTWHCIYLLSSLFKDEYFNLHRAPQASVYLLGHAFDGSIRDFSLFTYPLTFIDPAIARDFLKFIYTCIDEQGKITYALHGFGKKLNVPGVHSNPSDQYFFVTWITAEYVFLTRDFGFFNEPITIKNAQGKGKEILVKELLGRLIKFVLSPAIGLGDHGMVHVRDGDWNDGITFLAKNRSAFIKHGESTFNSAMLLLSFAKAIPLVERFDPSLASEMQSAMTTVHEAIDHAWNGKWYARGYDGKGNALGNDTMFLDHHAWMLQNSSLPAEKMDVLLASIETELIDRSRCGAAIMYPPNPRSSIYPPGWDINGGTWHALNSLLAWGLRARVPEKALMFLERMSMHHRAEEYPNIWYGIWSGPDSYNADYAERPGEAFFHSSTPMCDFPFMNNNLHAGFLSAVARFTGVEACFDRIKIDLIHDHPFTFRSKIINIEKTRGFIKIEPGRNFKDDFMIEISIPGPDASRASIKIEPDQEFMIEGNRIVVQWLKESPISSISIQLE